MPNNEVINKYENQTDDYIKNLDVTIHEGLFIEAFHNQRCISDKEYFTKYHNNAENLSQNLQIRKELKEVEEVIEKIEKS